ncbi:hypothetical protein Bhyg_02984, partial [Pseudolycoriella hygida]
MSYKKIKKESKNSNINGRSELPQGRDNVISHSDFLEVAANEQFLPRARWNENDGVMQAMDHEKNSNNIQASNNNDEEIFFHSIADGFIHP